MTPIALEGLNTLGLSGTDLSPDLTKVNGLGADLNDTDMLRLRAKRKLVSQSMAEALIQVAEKRGAEERVKQYWNVYNCANNMIVHGDRVYTPYCKNRCCTVCLAIRKAEIINKYFPVLSLWPDPHMATLTVKSVKAKDLRRIIDNMMLCFGRIKDKYKKQEQRGKGQKLIGIRSLESNYNPQRRTYNPHLHVIVPERWMAQTLRLEWIARRTSPKWVCRKAQDVRPVWSTESGMMELIKYGSKIFTEYDLKKKRDWTEAPTIYAAALDTILAAMHGKRIFDRFGFDLPLTIEKPVDSQLISDCQKFAYNKDAFDWVDGNSGELLTGYQQDPKLVDLLVSNINTTLN